MQLVYMGDVKRGIMHEASLSARSKKADEHGHLFSSGQCVIMELRQVRPLLTWMDTGHQSWGCISDDVWDMTRKDLIVKGDPDYNPEFHIYQ